MNKEFPNPADFAAAVKKHLETRGDTPRPRTPLEQELDASGNKTIRTAAEKEIDRLMALVRDERYATWNAAMKRAAEIADYYAQLYKSQGAARAADDIRACKLPLPSPENLK